MPQDDYIDLVQGYEKLIHDSMSIRNDLPNGWCAISTPFLDSDNDGLVVYVKREGERITLSDDFYILSWLRPVYGDSSEESKKRNRQAIQVICNYQILVTPEKEMVMETDVEHFASSFHFFLRAMMAASDILSLM